MLATGDRVAVAVSGGPDSVCLLHVLLELAPKLGVTVAGVAHFNHRLRGEASEEDERFVAALASRHGVPFLCQRESVAEAGGNLEQAARRARQAFFSCLIQRASRPGSPPATPPATRPRPYCSACCAERDQPV